MGFILEKVREACFREGKVELLNKFLDKQGFNPDKSWFIPTLKMIYR